jgi:tyrosinase
MGTYTVPSGTVVNGKDPLTPFHSDDAGNFHTGVTVASTKTFGYTYPGIDDWSAEPEETARNVTALVKRLYGINVPSLQQRDGETAWKEYYVQVGIEGAEVGGPGTVNILLHGQVAGSMVLLSMRGVGRTYSEIPLTRPISQLALTLADDAVIPFLRQQLAVEIRKVRKTERPRC